MATLTFTGSRPTPRQKSVLVVGQVNAEPITVVVDESWGGLQLELQFFHSVTHPEVPVVRILDETMTCNVPPEVTKEVGVVHVALAGRDSGTIIKLSEKLYYADAKIGADPQGGLTPEQQTPDYIAQMIAIQEETKAVAQSVRNDADNGLFDGEPGKSPIIQDGNWWIWDIEAQQYRDTGVAASGGGGGGTTDYTKLSNKPQINGVELNGNKTAQDLNLQPKGDYATTSSKLANPFSVTFTGAVEATYDGSQSVTVTIPTIAGPTGATPDIQIGTVDTLEPGSDATATITGTPESPRLNLGIPRGQNGKTPEKGIDYFTESEIQDVAKQAAELVPGGGGTIDDDTISTGTTWSSLKIVESLAPEFEESGPVVTCNPVPGYPLSVVSQVKAVQSGTGDPSTDNVRPISGWDEANLWIVGKNLFNISGEINRNPLGEYQGVFNFVEDGVLTANANSVGMYLVGQIIHVKKGTPVIFSFDMLSTGTGTNGYVCIYELGSPIVGMSSRPRTPGHYVSYEYTPKTDVIVFAFGTSGGKGAKYKNISLTLKSEGGEYEPYKGLAHIATFEDTIYGGTLNWTTGELSVTHICANIQSTDAWGDSIAVNGYILQKDFGIAEGGAVLCNIAPVSYDGGAGALTASVAYGCVRMSDFKTLFPTIEEWRGFLDEIGGVQVCGKLKTPTTVKLTPTEILALTGTNTIYTNTGDTTVSGRADPNATIKGLLSRIDALEKAVIGGV